MLKDYSSTEEEGWMKWILASVGLMGLGLGASLYLRKQDLAKSDEIQDEFKLVE